MHAFSGNDSSFFRKGKKTVWKAMPSELSTYNFFLTELGCMAYPFDQLTQLVEKFVCCLYATKELDQ